MDIGSFIRNIEDFLKNRIQKEFLGYKLVSLKKEALDKKKEPGKGLSYSHGVLLLLEALNEIESSLMESSPDFNNSLEKLNKAKKFIEKAAEQSPNKRKSLLEDKVSDSHKTDHKTVLLSENFSPSCDEIKPDDTLSRLKEELKEMKLSSDNKLAKLNQLTSLLPPDSETISLSSLDEVMERQEREISDKKYLLPLSGLDIKPEKTEKFFLNKETEKIVETGLLSDFMETKSPDEPIFFSACEPLSSDIMKKSEFNIDNLIDRKEKFKADIISDNKAVDNMRNMAHGLNKSMADTSYRKKTKELSEFDLPVIAHNEPKIMRKEMTRKSTGDLSEVRSFLQKQPVFSREIDNDENNYLPNINSVKENTDLSNIGFQGFIPSERDFNTPHKFKSPISHKIPYSHSPKIDSTMRYSESIPLDSPLYSLLTGYQNLRTYKIDFKSWMKNQDESLEELNYLLNKLTLIENEVSADKLGELINLGISVVQELKFICQEIDKDKNRKKIYEALHGRIYEEEDEEIKDLIQEIKEINLEIYSFFRDVLPQEETHSVSSIEEDLNHIPEAEYRTPMYVKLETAAMGFLRKEIGKEDFIKVLEEIIQIIGDSMEKYQSLEVSGDEITLEVYKGNQFISDAFENWQKGISSIKKYFLSQKEDDIHRGLKFIYEGTKKLIFLQHFSRQIEKQAQVQTFQLSFSMGRKKIN